MTSLLVRLGLVFALLLSVVAGEASFYDVRTKLRQDHSNARNWPAQKYFRESDFHPHYDGRFTDHEVEEVERLSVLTNMMKTFLSTMADIGAETWIMHGTLLGWWWNQKILPWDDDIDVQVSMPTIEMLAKYFNMTEYHYQLPGGKKGTYLLEINPHYITGGTDDRHNRIDGRWIDTDHGLFIDISTVRPDLARRAHGVEGALFVKDRHRYLERDIFPLRDSFFEGIHVKVPFEYMTLLEEEYGESCFTDTTFEGHHFNDTSKIWQPIVNYQRGDHRSHGHPEMLRTDMSTSGPPIDMSSPPVRRPETVHPEQPYDRSSSNDDPRGPAHDSEPSRYESRPPQHESGPPPSDSRPSPPGRSMRIRR